MSWGYMCYIVFDIDGMLLECFMNFINIEKNIFIFIFFNISCFLRVSCYFQHKKKKIGVKKKFWGGGGGGVEFFFRKTILSYFTFYAIFNITKNRNPPSVRPSVHHV